MNLWEHRYNHENFGDVYSASFKEGIIRGFGLSNTDPITLDDTCDVEVEGRLYPSIPIFYHCRKGFYDDDVATLRNNHSLNRAAWAFRVNHRAKVMFNGDVPLAVIGHNDDQYVSWPRPRKCLDLFKLHTISWYKGLPDLNRVFKTSTQLAYSARNEPEIEPDGTKIVWNCQQQRIFGEKDRNLGTVMYFFGDWFILVGPVAYILRLYTVGLPMPAILNVGMSAAIWTPELEDYAIVTGQKKEDYMDSLGWWWNLPLTMNTLEATYRYEGFYHQTFFTGTMRRELLGMAEQLAPRWSRGEAWVYDWDRGDQE